MPKRSKQHQTPWTRWNSEGMNAAEDFIHKEGKRLIQTKPTDDLKYFRARLQEALDDFKNLYSKDLPHDEGMTRRNAETHAKTTVYRWTLGFLDQVIERIPFTFTMEKSWGASIIHSKSVQSFTNILPTIGKLIPN